MGEDESATCCASVGLDIGGTTVRAAVQDGRGRIMHETQVPSSRLSSDIPEGIGRLVEELRAVALPEGADLAAVGIGLPGAVHPINARVHRCTALPALHDIDVLADLQLRLGTKVALANDANLGAWAEFLYGGHAARTLVSLALGTGVGAGIVVDGRMLRGEHGAAGEIAELLIQTASGPAHLESVVSAGGLLAARGSDNEADIPKIIAAAAAGEAVSLDAVRRYCRPLSDAVASLVSILDPCVIVMTGGLGARDVVVDTLRELLRERAVGVPVVISALGDRAPLVGALALAREVAAGTTAAILPHPAAT